MAIYLLSTFILFSIASWIFYQATARNIVQQQMRTLKLEAKHMMGQLRALHFSSAPELIYPSIEGASTAIYDIDKGYIFGDFSSPPSLDIKPPEGYLQFVVPVEPHYLGAAYLLVQKPLNDLPLVQLRRNILLYMIGGGLLFVVLGYYLGRLFIAPMRESVEQMNRFIEDTTHELNTPISTILTNIEMIEELGKGKDAKEELGRIEIASRTLSRIYDDLSFISLKHPYHREIIDVDMGSLARERIEYFTILAEAKEITIDTDIAPNVHLSIDLNDAVRMVDNILSNAIKYNRTNGKINVKLTDESLSITDTGVGIAPDKLSTIHERFRRANASEGGFGIGLDIVYQVTEHYGFGFDISSQIDKGTRVLISWNRQRSDDA